MLLLKKVALITGSARGIGRAIALRFSEEGASVIICDLDMDGAEEVYNIIKSYGREALVFKADVSDESQVKALFQKVISTYGTLDILVNNAGICKNIPIPEISGDEWDRFLRVNLKSVFLCSKEAFIIMKKKRYGRIINMGSAAGKIGGLVAGAHYSAAKAGVLCLTKSLALQAAEFNITVNAIAPGPIATHMTAEWGEEINRAFREKIPLKRYGTPEEVAEVALFLASDRSSYITGEIIDVNGGLVMD